MRGPESVPRLHAGLFLLALRRALSPALLISVALLLWISATRDWGLSEAALPADESGILQRAFARQAVWAIALFLIVPVLVMRSCGMARDWQRSESQWIAPLPLAKGGWVLSSYLGVLCAALLALGGVALISSIVAGQGGPAWRRLHSLEHPALCLLDGDPAQRWEQSGCAPDARSGGGRLLLHPTVAPGSAPAATLRFGLLGEQGTRLASVESRIFGRSRLALDLPDGSHDTALLELERTSDGATVVLPEGSLELLVPARCEGLADLELLLRALLAVATWIALGMGLAAWMRPAIAALLLLAAWSLIWSTGWMHACLPGSDLGAVWGRIGEGLVPESVPPSALLLAGLGVLAGLLLLRLGLDRPSHG